MIVYAFTIGVCALFAMNEDLVASTQKNEIKTNNLYISSDDYKNLESFLRRILFIEGFAYTLFSDKPMSCGHFKLDKCKSIDSHRSNLSGYRVLEKYAYLFPQEQFLFLFYENQDEGCCEITLINKKAFRLTIDKHKTLFTNIFGSAMTAEQLLNLLIQRRSLWNTPIRDRDDLIGILLGFGETNAKLFQKRREILGRNEGVKKNRTTPSVGYHCIEEELSMINTSLQPFSDEQPNSLYYMYLPSFIADFKNAETTQLKKKYTEQRKHITQRYSHGNIIEITLEQLYSGDSNSSLRLIKEKDPFLEKK